MYETKYHKTIFSKINAATAKIDIKGDKTIIDNNTTNTYFVYGGAYGSTMNITPATLSITNNKNNYTSGNDNGFFYMKHANSLINIAPKEGIIKNNTTYHAMFFADPGKFNIKNTMIESNIFTTTGYGGLIRTTNVGSKIEVENVEILNNEDIKDNMFTLANNVQATFKNVKIGNTNSNFK